MIGRRPFGPVLLLLALAAPPALPAGFSDCARVVAVGDLHGAFDSFVLILRSTGLIDEQLAWSGGDACLLQLGDIVDRGPESREILDLLMRLGEQAPDRVETLVGNHEVMTMLGDVRYAAPEEFAAFAEEETPEQRARGLAAFQGPEMRELFDATFPPGWFARRQAFSPAGRYGSWLLSRPMMVRIDGTLYVHGGPRPEDARKGIKKINRSLAWEVKEHIRLKHELIRVGWLSDLTPYDISLHIVRDSLNELTPVDISRGVAPLAEKYLMLAMHGTLGPRGPLWNRDLARADEDGFASSLTGILTVLDVKRIVAAHTTTEDGRIRRRFDDRVFLIDTGAGPAYGGQISALEVSRGGVIRAYYPGGSELLVDPPITDDGIEAFLREATIVDVEELAAGAPLPLTVRLELNGVARRAAFRAVSAHEPGMAEAKVEYERAAYLLDRCLGIHMVPVAVLRPLEHVPGVLIDWIPDAMTEAERREKNPLPEEPQKLIYQRAVMTIFDALLSNSDRNLTNQWIAGRDARLHLIDHSRTFGLVEELPPGFESTPMSMPRELFPRLLALDAGMLGKALDDLVSKAQIKAVLKRKDRLLAKLERDRNEFGDAQVFVAR